MGARFRPARKLRQPDIAFLLLGAPTLSEVRLGDTWAHACTPEYDARYRDRLTGAVDTLGSTGARVDHCRTEVDGVELRPDAQALASSSRVSPPAAYSGPTSMEGAEPSGVTQEVATCTTSQSLPCLRWAQ